MIVCSCNILSCRELRQGVETLLEGDPYAMLTPGRVYRCLDKRLKCGGCMPNAVDIIHRHAAELRCRAEIQVGGDTVASAAVCLEEDAVAA